MDEVGGDGFLIITPLMRISRRYIGEVTEGLVPLVLQDIFDYGIGPLWLRGIDGAGTRTIAVMEGWKDPNIGKVIAGYDKIFGLPNPKITTIFPASPPKKCPPGMVALGSYGSCQAWAASRSWTTRYPRT